MKTQTSSFIMTKAFPLDKSEIHYNPSSEEVTIKREKFDGFVKYIQALEEKLEAAEDARDVAQYRARKAGKTGDVLQALTEDVLKGTAAVREWLRSPSHSIMDLSARTGIPYATCHRIVNERLGTPNVQIGHLKKMVSAVSRDRRPFAPGVASHPRYRRVLFGLPKGLAEDELVSSWQMKGSEVSTVHGGLEIAQKMKELHPDLILVDVSMPNLEKSGFQLLKNFAKHTVKMIVLTGEIAETNSALLQGSFEKENKADELASEGETPGG
jgi:CheY-like chemotaxis protein